MTNGNSKWTTIRRGDGAITGYVEVFYVKTMNQWVTIPGISRFLDGARSADELLRSEGGHHDPSR